MTTRIIGTLKLYQLEGHLLTNISQQAPNSGGTTLDIETMPANQGDNGLRILVGKSQTGQHLTRKLSPHGLMLKEMRHTPIKGLGGWLPNIMQHSSNPKDSVPWRSFQALKGMIKYVKLVVAILVNPRASGKLGQNNLQNPAQVKSLQGCSGMLRTNDLDQFVMDPLRRDKSNHVGKILRSMENMPLNKAPSTLAKSRHSQDSMRILSKTDRGVSYTG
jgi:hypothetical protein